MIPPLSILDLAGAALSSTVNALAEGGAMGSDVVIRDPGTTNSNITIYVDVDENGTFNAAKDQVITLVGVSDDYNLNAGDFVF